MSLIKVTINGVDILSEYGVYVKSRDIPLPEPKTTFVDVDGANGSIDLSTVLTNGEVRFSDRDAGIVLTAIGDVNKARDDVSRLLHGKVCQIVFSDDLTHFYEGRLWVDKWAYSYSISEFQIKGKLKPFRYSINETVISESVRGSKTLVIENDSDYRLTPEINLTNIQPVTEYSFDWSGTKDASTTIGTPVSGIGPNIVNLTPNPSFEAAGSTVEVRRNLHPNPDLKSDSSGWGEPFGVESARLTDFWTADLPSGYSLRVFSTSGVSSASSVYLSGAIPVTPGQVITVSFWTITNGVSIPFAPRVMWGGGTYSVAPTFTATYEYTMCSFTVTVPAGETTMRIRPLFANGLTSTQALRFRRALVEATTQALPYFDWTVSPDPDLTPSALGTPGDSASVLTATRAAYYMPYGTNAQCYQSIKWSNTGSKSLCVDGSLMTSVGIAPEAIVATDSGSALSPGKTYTVAAYLRLTEPGIDVISRMRRFMLYTSSDGGSTYIPTGSDTAPNEPGVHLMRWIFTIPSDADRYILRLGGNGSAAYGVSGDACRAWWDDFTIVEGNYPGLLPFHGDSENIYYGDGFQYPASDKPMTLTDDTRKYFLHEGDNVNGFSVAPNETKTVKLVGAGDLTMTYREKVI